MVGHDTKELSYRGTVNVKYRNVWYHFVYTYMGCMLCFMLLCGVNEMCPLDRFKEVNSKIKAMIN